MSKRAAVVRIAAWSLIALAVGAPNSRAQNAVSEELRRLDALLLKEAGWQEAQFALRRSAIPERAKIEWLEKRAEEGLVAYQFELAAMLHRKDFEQSLKWYARALLGGALDAAACPGRASLGWLLDLVEPVRSDGIEQPDLMERAIVNALAQKNVLDLTPWSQMVCIEREPSLTVPERLKRRVDGLEDMKKEARAFSLFAKAVRLGKERAYPVYDTGIIIGPSWPKDQATWADNERLLIVGNTPATFRLNEHNRDLFFWTTSGQAHRRITPDGFFVHEVCSHDGTIEAQLTRINWGPGDAFVLYGRVPELKIDDNREWFGSSMSGFNTRPGCGPAMTLPVGLRHGDVRWLLERDGYLESLRTGLGFQARTTLVKADGTRIPLPELPLVRSSDILGFASWRNAYLLQGTWVGMGSDVLRARERGEGALLFWLYSDGRLEKVPIPYGYWDQYQPPSSAYWPTRKGIASVGKRAERDDRPGFSGLYLFEDVNTPVLLHSGVVDLLAVSPNGCNVAFAQRAFNKAPHKSRTAKVASLCKD